MSRMFRVLVSLTCLAVLVLAVSGTAMAAVTPPAGSEVISNPLIETLNATVAQKLNLGWTIASTNVKVDIPFDIITTAELADPTNFPSVDRVLYIIEVTRDGVVATNVDLQAVANGQDGAGGNTVVNVPLGYDAAGGFFFFGDRTNGFTFSSTAQITTTFTVTIKKPGTYNVKAYAVQLP